jgi:hypothetical protein
MGESLIQQFFVGDEGSNDCKTLSSKKIMTVFEEEVPANSVPAAAVRRRGQVLFELTGRKEREDGLLCLWCNPKKIIWSCHKYK